MKYFCFENLLLSEGWKSKVYVGTDKFGNITEIGSKKPKCKFEKITGYSIPGFVNGHSHAFQYAMVGMTENLAPNNLDDDFWTWRERMYNLAHTITPKESYEVAKAVFSEMLFNGYTWVNEFHYLHHQPDGKRYKDPLEMSYQILEAAKDVGIGLTLIPVFYQKGGFGLPPEERQTRFLFKDADDYLEFLEKCQKAISKYPRTKLGASVHSLRAVGKEDILKTFNGLPGVPKHMHVSETRKEVKDCQQHYGKRPVEWLSEHLDLSSDYSFTHCTHLTTEEMTALDNFQVNVVLCPSTEGNLGDGFFQIRDFTGHWTIGTDSQVCLSPFEDLRWLDYGARLQSGKRNTFVRNENQDSGDIMIREALGTGRTSAGFKSRECFAVGSPLDVIHLSDDNPFVAVTEPSKLLSTLIYSGISKSCLKIMAGGKWRSKSSDGKLTKTLKALASRI